MNKQFLILLKITYFLTDGCGAQLITHITYLLLDSKIKRQVSIPNYEITMHTYISF